jgi:phosphoribosyl 1,2-cyclic phosphodiesterase
MDIIFIGSGGGRWVTLYQKMGTGGFRIHAEKKIHVDPGPGTLVGLADMKIRPTETDVLVVSHCHPDHYTDAEVMIEAMTNGMTRRKGVLLASKSVMVGHDGLGPGISSYHQSKLTEKKMTSPGDSLNIGSVIMEALPTSHGDPTTFGFKCHTKEGIITYTSDTEYHDGIADNYTDSKVLILNTMRPGGDRISNHLCTEDVVKIVSRARPEIAVMNHFGMKFIGRTEQEARVVEEATGIRTLAAREGMRLSIETDINVGNVFNRKGESQTKLNI